MSTFRVIIDQKPGIKFPKEYGELDFSFLEKSSPFNVKIRPILKEIEGVSLPIGLRFKFTIERDNIDVAINDCLDRANGICTFMAFSVNYGIPPCFEVIAYNATPGIINREFVQTMKDERINDISQTISRRVINPGELDTIIRAIYGSTHPSADRIQRALVWYRQGLLNNDNLDAFQSFWCGLENLEKPLKNKLSVPDQPPKCNHCGGDLTTLCSNCGDITEPQYYSGLKSFFNTYFGSEPRLFAEIKRLRNNIGHGNDPIADLRTKVGPLLPKLEGALEKAIFLLLDLDQMKWADRKVSLKKGESQIRIDAVLTGFSPDDVETDGFEPHYREEEVQIQPRIVGTEISFNIKHKGKPIRNDSTRFTRGEISIELSDPDVRIEHTSLDDG